jgi:hypothetical protein
MTEDNKFILVLGNTEDIAHLQDDLIKIRDIGINAQKNPAIAAVYETFAECAKDYAEKFRESGKKVGVYATREKAMSYYFKALDILDSNT